MPCQITRAAAAFGVVMALSACTNPYDPGQRALGGGAIGAGAGAAIGGLAGGWHGAAIGAVAGRGARCGWRSSDHAAPTTARVLLPAPTARLFAALLN